MTQCPGCGADSHPPGRLEATLARLEAEPWSAADLDNHIVCVLLMWSDGRHEIIRREAERRIPRWPRFAALLDEPDPDDDWHDQPHLGWWTG